MVQEEDVCPGWLLALRRGPATDLGDGTGARCMVLLRAKACIWYVFDSLIPLRVVVVVAAAVRLLFLAPPVAFVMLSHATFRFPSLQGHPKGGPSSSQIWRASSLRVISQAQGTVPPFVDGQANNEVRTKAA